MPRTWTGVTVTLSIIVVALSAFHAFDPTGGVGMLAYPVILIAPTVAWVGAMLAPRESRLVPLLLATGLTMAALGDLSGLAGYHLLSYEATASSPAHFTYLVSYAAFGAALLVTTRQRRGGRREVNLEVVLDALTVIVVSVLLYWNISVLGVVSDYSVPGPQRLTHAVYLAADIVLLVIAARAMTVPTARKALGAPFAVGICFWLASDFGYMVIEYRQEISTPLDVLRTVGAVLIATAAFRRAVETESAHPEVSTARKPMRKLGIAVVPLLVPLVQLIINDLTGQETIPTRQAIVVMAVLAAIAFARTAGLLRTEDQARSQLAAARDAALEASRAKSSFLATMSHEIRTPMNGVIGLTGLMLDTELDNRQRQYAEGVQVAGNALLTVINDVLDFSKIESGHLELEEIDLDVVQVIEEVAELVAGPARAKGLELIAYSSLELPTPLRGDPSRLRQVLLNLAGNAVKFTAAGEVVIHAHLDSSTSDGVVVRFTVTDTGIGIAEEGQRKLFAPFSQADSNTTRQYGGTGLGLSISRELVTAMGGTIGLVSAPGEGSTFSFTVALAHPQPEAACPAGTATLDGLRVLVVDDNATHGAALQEQLTARNVTVTLADNPASALTALTQGRGDETFDVVLLDEVEVASAISADPAMAGVKLVLLSSSPDVDHASTSVAGVTATMTKPVRFSKLPALLQDVVGRRTEPAPDRVPEPSTSNQGLVLVVEDGEINQIVATGMLERLGYTVEVAADGLEGVAAVRRDTYDAILMDVQMPGMDGYEATAEIRSIEGTGRRTPIIAMTAGAVDGDRERCLGAGMDDYVSKPISMKALEQALSRFIPA